MDAVGVIRLVDGRSMFVDAVPAQAAPLERVQQRLQQGPCQDAMDSGRPVFAGSRSDMAWPEFERIAARESIGAVLAVPLRSSGRSWGCLDLYWRRKHELTESDSEAAQLLADVVVSNVVMASHRTGPRPARLTGRSQNMRCTTHSPGCRTVGCSIS
ncbi:GAF domain-containing protein [Nakamurella alba]|uniref:GAF domain-containing protein n=1 Tax=Nakamurella alba TaxID=2665158 RepID=UPI0038990D09